METAQNVALIYQEYGNKMNPHMFEKTTLISLKNYSKRAGTTLALFGSIAILFNILFPDTKSDIFFGFTLLIAGLIIAIFLYKDYYGNRLSILQSLIPLISGFVFLALPLKHDLAYLVTLVFYLFLDGFVKAAIGVSYRPLKKYIYVIYSGAFSVLLAMFIVFGWPLTNYWLLKLIVATNIFFDGIMFFNFSFGIEEEIEKL